MKNNVNQFRPTNNKWTYCASFSNSRVMSLLSGAILWARQRNLRAGVHSPINRRAWTSQQILNVRPPLTHQPKGLNITTGSQCQASTPPSTEGTEHHNRFSMSGLHSPINRRAWTSQQILNVRPPLTHQPKGLDITTDSQCQASTHPSTEGPEHHNRFSMSGLHSPINRRAWTSQQILNVRPPLTHQPKGLNITTDSQCQASTHPSTEGPEHHNRFSMSVLHSPINRRAWTSQQVHSKHIALWNSVTMIWNNSNMKHCNSIWWARQHGLVRGHIRWSHRIVPTAWWHTSSLVTH